MRKYLMFLWAAAAIALGAADRRIEIGNPVVDLSGKDAEIVVAPEAPKTTCFAARELKEFLDGVPKAKVPVVTAPTAGKFHFYLGVNKWSKAAGLDDSKLIRDAFLIRNTKDGVYILGIDDPKADPERALKSGVWAQLYERGTLFGVYDWLERFAGVRFYFPGELGTVVPEKRSISVPGAEIFDFPDFTDRKYSIYNGAWPGRDASDRAFPEKNLAYYRYRQETRYVPNCHGLARLGYLLRFGKSRPDYFALMENGQRHCNPSLPHPGSLCYSSGIGEEIYQDAKSFLLGEPASKRGVQYRSGKVSWDPSAVQPGYFNIMPQDAYYRCRCKTCESKFGSGANYATEFMWNFVADAARRLKKEKVPGFVTMMAYRPYREIPAVDIPDNVLVMVAERGPWGRYNSAGQQKDNAEIAAWHKKLGRKVWLWNYLCKFGATAFTGVPSPSPNAVVPYLKAVNPHITGAYFESETDRYINNYLTYYIHGKYSWNNRIDANAMIAEHHKLMFGPAAPEMEKIFDLFEKIWLTQIVGRQIETDLGPAVVPPSDYDLWHKIYTAPKIAEIRAFFERAEKLAAKDPKALARVRLFRSEWLEPLAAAREDYLSRTDAVKRFSCSPSRPAYLIPFRAAGRKNQITQKPVSTRIVSKLEGDRLNIIFDCEEPNFSKAVAVKRSRDDIGVWRDNGVEIFLNPSGDRKHYYQLILNTLGSLTDQKLELVGNKSNGDLKWESGAECKVTPTKEGFRAEVSIPVKNLPGFRKEGFPVNFGRNRILSEGTGFDTLYIWSPFARGFHDLENYGTLKFEDELQRSILKNGDFSAPRRGRFFDGWYGPQKVGEKQSFGLDREIFFSGPQSMKLVNQDGNEMTVGQYLKGMKPDTEYTVSCYVRFENVKPLKKGGGVCVNLNVAGNRWFPTNFPVGSSDGWVRQEFTFRTPAGLTDKNNPYIRLRIFNATGTVWFDDVRLEEVSSKQK